jgi:catechol 2,3-dioxygenase-like lactoylglutathione lyase family enzyme
MEVVMAKLLGPDFIALQVRDLAASRQFYIDHLGLTPAPASPPGAVVFQTAPVPFAIREPLVDLDDADKLGWGVSLWIACDDADALHARLAGVAEPTPVADGPFGRFFVFHDPDGYAVTVHQPPAEG